MQDKKNNADKFIKNSKTSNSKMILAQGENSDKIEKTDEMRLQVFLSKCGVASRRASEKIILEGNVSVNGKIVTEMGTKVSSKDTVTVNGKKITLETQKRYVLLNKPAGFVCSLSDEQNRPVAYDLLKDSYSERLYNVGRLDMYSKGLIIFTNDGDFAAILSHPSAELEKEYIVETSQNIPEDFPQKFMHGIRVENVFYKCKYAQIIGLRKIKIVLVEGKNREIRNVLESFGMGTKTLTRVRIGNVEIEDLRPGEFRNLTKNEISNLLELCKNSNLAKKDKI